MTRALYSFVSCIALVASAYGTELTQDDYDIWHAAIRNSDPHRVIYVWHLIEPLEALGRITVEGALKAFPEARPTGDTWRVDAAEVDLRSFDAAVQRRPPRSGPGAQYALLDAATLEQLLGTTPNEHWVLNPAVLAEAEAVCRLTRPVIRSDGRVAYLIYVKSTKSWGALISCTLHRDAVDGSWRVTTCGRTTLTNWKDGKPVSEEEKPANACSCR